MYRFINLPVHVFKGRRKPYARLDASGVDKIQPQRITGEETKTNLTTTKPSLC